MSISLTDEQFRLLREQADRLATECSVRVRTLSAVAHGDDTISRETALRELWLRVSTQITWELLYRERLKGNREGDKQDGQETTKI